MANPSIRLDGRTRLTANAGWPTHQLADIDTPFGGSLSLSPLCGDGTPTPNSERLCLNSQDGTMGSLRLPPWLAVSPQGSVYLLRRNRILGLVEGAFRPLPLPRTVTEAKAIHATSVRYLVGRIEVLVFDHSWRVIEHIKGMPNIVDSTVDGDCMLLLFNNRLWRIIPGTFAPEPLPALPGGRTYRNVLALTDGNRALLDDDGKALLVDAENRHVREVRASTDLAEFVKVPALRLDGQERFALAHAMLKACPVPVPSPPLENPLIEATRGGRVFDRNGQPVEPQPRILATAPVFAESGWWISKRLDGTRDAQVWRDGRIGVAALPPGTGIRLESFSSDDPDGLPVDLKPGDHEGFFKTAFIHREPAQKSPERPEPSHVDFHVASRPGRYLWLRIVLTSDGRRTPRLSSVMLNYGGDRPLDLLPSEFRRQEPMRDHLERLLSLMATGTSDVQVILDRAKGLFDPRFSNQRMFDLIASLLGLSLDPRLPDAAQRWMLWLQLQSKGAPGTRARLHERLVALIAANRGLAVEQIADWVRIIEGFETRDTIRLGQNGARLGRKPGQSLSAGIALGEEVLDSRTDPAVAGFQTTAHRVEIALPRALAPNETVANMLSRAIAEEVPAHIAVTLTRPTGGITLAGNVRLGIGTVLLDPRVIRLQNGQLKNGRATRLGIDAKLAKGSAQPSAVRLAGHQGGSGRLL